MDLQQAADRLLATPQAATTVGVYCHRCQRSAGETPSDGVCPTCGEGFVEDLTRALSARVRRLALVASLIALTDRRPRAAQPEVLSTLRSVEFSADRLLELHQLCSCVICQEDFTVGSTLTQLPLCGHVFHDSCVREWLGRADTCPICRRSLADAPREGAAGVESDRRERARRRVEMIALALQSRVAILRAGHLERSASAILRAGSVRRRSRSPRRGSVGEERYPEIRGSVRDMIESADSARPGALLDLQPSDVLGALNEEPEPLESTERPDNQLERLRGGLRDLLASSARARRLLDLQTSEVESTERP